MSGLSKVFDAAIPPAIAPAGCAGVLGYIGRPGKAVHTWDKAEWERFAHLTQFPCWVPNLLNHAGLEAQDVTAALKSAGWYKAAVAQVVIIDYETAGAAEAEWHGHMAEALGAQGFAAIAYGSLSTVLQTEAAHIWAASWDGRAVLNPAGQTVHGHQYAANVAFDTTQVDYSVADEWLMQRGLHR